MSDLHEWFNVLRPDIERYEALVPSPLQPTLIFDLFREGLLYANLGRAVMWRHLSAPHIGTLLDAILEVDARSRPEGAVIGEEATHATWMLAMASWGGTLHARWPAEFTRWLESSPEYVSALANKAIERRASAPRAWLVEAAGMWMSRQETLYGSRAAQPWLNLEGEEGWLEAIRAALVEPATLRITTELPPFDPPLTSWELGHLAIRDTGKAKIAQLAAVDLIVDAGPAFIPFLNAWIEPYSEFHYVTAVALVTSCTLHDVPITVSEGLTRGLARAMRADYGILYLLRTTLPSLPPAMLDEVLTLAIASGSSRSLSFAKFFSATHFERAWVQIFDASKTSPSDLNPLRADPAALKHASQRLGSAPLTDLGWLMKVLVDLGDPGLEALSREMKGGSASRSRAIHDALKNAGPRAEKYLLNSALPSRLPMILAAIADGETMETTQHIASFHWETFSLPFPTGRVGVFDPATRNNQRALDESIPLGSHTGRVAWNQFNRTEALVLWFGEDHRIDGLVRATRGSRPAEVIGEGNQVALFDHGAATEAFWEEEPPLAELDFGLEELPNGPMLVVGSPRGASRIFWCLRGGTRVALFIDVGGWVSDEA